MVVQEYFILAKKCVLTSVFNYLKTLHQSTEVPVDPVVQEYG